MDIPPFDLTTSRTNDAAVVTIVGELDLSTAPQLLEVLAELAGNGTNDPCVHSSWLSATVEQSTSSAPKAPGDVVKTVKPMRSELTTFSKKKS